MKVWVMEQCISWVCFCFSVWTVAHPSALYEHHLCAVSSVFTVAYTLKEREGAVHNKNHNAKSVCLSGWGPEWCTHDTSHTLSPSVTMHGYHGKPAFETPPSLPLSLSTVLPLSFFMSLYLSLSPSHYLTLPPPLVPFLNLRGACVYSIFIILGGTVDRWDTCTITGHNITFSKLIGWKTHSLSSRLTGLALQKGGYYIMKTSPILDRKYNSDLLTKSL